MKKIAGILLIICFCGFVKAQNLVPNPSFEDYSLCPDNWAQIDRVNSWETYKGTPDYFNNCEPTNSFSTPQNLMGNQMPSSGEAYVGLIFFSRNGLNADEIMGIQTTAPLLIGTKYFVSLKVVLKYNSPFGVCCANNKIGVRFSTQSYLPSNPPQINDFAHVWTDSVINDTINWTTIFGSFVADSTYNYLMVGNFYSNPNITINDIIPANDFGYYFVDDVCVSTDSLFAATYLFTGLYENELKRNFSIYPNPSTDYFTIQKNTLEEYNLSLYNAIGDLLYEERSITNITKKYFLSEFPNGLLMVKITSKGKSYSYKLIKQ